MPNVLAPTVHMNGSGRDDLTAGYEKADRALRAALDALAGTHPNGRDYYPQGTGAIRVAMDQHKARVDRLTAVRAEINEILEAMEG